MAAEEKIDSYVDRPAVADDTKFLMDQLKAVLELFDKVNATKLSLNIAKTMGETVTAVKETTKAVDDLKAGKDKLLTVDLETIRTIKENAKALKDLNAGYQELIQQSVQNEIAGKKLRDARAQLNKAFKDGKITSEELAVALEEIKIAELELKVTNEQLGRALKNLERDAQSTEGSLNKLRAQLNLSLQAFDALSAEEKSSDVGVELKKKIQGLTDAITAEEESTGRFQRNVGNYKGSAKIIVDALSVVENKINDLQAKQQGLADFSKRNPIGFRTAGGQNDLDKVTAELNNLTAQAQSLNAVTSNPQFLNIAGKIGDTNAELKFFTKQLNALEDAGLKNEQVYKDVQKRLAELTDQIGDTRAEIKAMSSDTRSFDLFAGAVNFAADAFQTLAGAAALSADSEEQVQEVTKTLLAIQTVANGVKGIANELTTKGTAANKAYTFAQNQVAIAMDTTATAGARLKAALITLGIGAVIIGIGLLIANFDKIKRAITGVSKEQEAYNKALAESSSAYVEAVKLVSQLKINIELAKQGFIDKKAVLKEYNDSLGKSTGQVKDLNQAERELTEKGEAYIQITLLKAAANLALEEAAKKAFEAEQIRRKKEEEFANVGDKILSGKITSGGGSFFDSEPTQSQKETQRYITEQEKKRKEAQVKTVEDERKNLESIGKKFQADAAAIAKKYKINLIETPPTEQRAKTNKFYDELLKAQADSLKKLSENQDAYLLTRVNAREKSASLEKQILRGQQQTEIDNINAQIAIEKAKPQDKIDLNKIADLNDKKIELQKEFAIKSKLLENQLNEDLQNIRQTSIAKQREIDQQNNDQFFKDQEDRLKAEIDNIQKQQERQFAEEVKGREAELKNLNTWYQKRIEATKEGSKARNKVEEKYAQERAEIEYRYAVAALKTQIAVAEKIIAVRKIAGAEVAEDEKKLHELQIELSDIETKHIEENNKRQTKSHQEKLENLEKSVEKIKNVYDSASNFVTGLISAITDRQKNAIQDQIDAADKKKEKETEAVNASALSEQEKADKIAVINARAAAQKEALERRQRQLDLQRARFEKAANIGRIIVETALAVVHQLASGDPFTATGRAIAAGAIGAAELAVAIATPLPKFKHGRKGGPATWAVTGDGGVHEVATSPDLKQAFLTPATDTLTYLPENWKVFPDVEAFQAAAMAMTFKPLPTLPVMNNNNDGLIRAMAYEIGGLKNAILGKQETHFHWDNGQLQKSIKNGNAWWHYVQNNI